MIKDKVLESKSFGLIINFVMNLIEYKIWLYICERTSHIREKPLLLLHKYKGRTGFSWTGLLTYQKILRGYYSFFKISKTVLVPQIYSD